MDTVWRSLFFGDAGYTAEDCPECFAPMTHAPHPPSLFSVELRTPRWELLVNWYRDILGLKVLLRVVDDHYALLDAGSTRLAIMGRPTAGEPSGRWSLGFETDDLDAVWHRLGAAAAPPRANPEGFRELVAFDPDGNKIRLFSWSAGHHA
jgi:catechol 2,3-dioxygenase-like lactoylglutathione lyase family enzyme